MLLLYQVTCAITNNLSYIHKMKKIINFANKYRNYVLVFLLALLILKVFIPQIDDLDDSIKALRGSNLYWIFAGIIVYFAGIVSFAVQIVVLALKKIEFGLTYRVEMAGQFVSKLLPSFVGVFGINMYYLIQKKHTANQATTVMTANALSSTIAFAFLTACAFILGDISINIDHLTLNFPQNLIYLLIILGLGVAFWLHRSSKWKVKIHDQWAEIKKNMRAYKDRPDSVWISIICNGLGSAANIFAICASAWAIGTHLSFADALVGYSFGNIAVSLVPTPGGLGAAEAGIYTGIVFVGVPGPEAITITLIYRLISYWLPIIPGYIFFYGLRKNVLSKFSLKNKYSSP